MLKHLADDSSLLLLYILNHIWLSQYFPTSWKTAIIIPVPKLEKVLSDLGSYSYRHISLERHMVITEFENGFRRRRSTVDNLVTLETSIIEMKLSVGSI